MTNSRHSIEGKHGTLLGLGEDNSTVSWGGSIEAIQPTGTLGDGREALLRMGLALTNLSRLREGRALRSEGGRGCWLRLSSSAVRARLVVACASRRPTANGRAEVARSAVETGTAVGNMRVTLAHDAAHDA